LATRTVSFAKTLLLALVLFVLLLPAGSAGSGGSARAVVVIPVEGTITAGQLQFIQRQIGQAVDRDAQLLVVLLNTPGGLVDSTIEINRAFLNARIPIAVFVAPSGAIAASAGVFILMSADIAAMAPGTTTGAAHPVAVSPEGTTPADEKTTAFLAEHISSLARANGRPPEIAERFVTENLTLSSWDALELGVIEYLAVDLDELLAELDGRAVEKQGRTYTLHTAGAPVEQAEMNLRERLQHWLSDPQIAFLLLMLGVLGIYFGLNAPGTIVPEVAGGILLVMGIYGIGLFDTNTAGIVLLILGIGLIIAEIFTAGFGILGIGGAVCLLAGAILLPLEPLMSADWYVSFRLTVIGVVIALTALTLFIAQRVFHSRRRWKTGSAYFMPPSSGVVVSDIAPEGMIKARGELWKARSDDGSSIAAGTEVEIVRAESLTLWVRPANDRQEGREE
jgi:membrane-bound serine protease (ClpP class)